MSRLQDPQAEARLLDYREAGPDYGPGVLESPKLTVKLRPRGSHSGINRRRHGIQMMRWSKVVSLLCHSIYIDCALFILVVISHNATSINNISSDR